MSIFDRWRRRRGVPSAPAARLAADRPAAAEITAIESVLGAGDWARAAGLADALIARYPTDPGAQAVRALVMLEAGEAPAAAEIFERLARRPGAGARDAANAVEALRRAGSPERALELAEDALAAWPGDADLLLNIAMALRETGQVERCIDMLRAALQLRPDWPRAHASLLFTLTRHAVDDAAMFDEHLKWGAAHADPLPRCSHAAHSRDPGKVLRIGYVSGDFCAHAISYFVTRLFERHDRSRVCVFAYYSGTTVDKVTARIEKAVDCFRHVAAMNDQDLAATIHADAVDVVVDLSGHTKGNRMLALARHPAPVQITWLGYLFSTGMRAMDYRLTDAVADPAPQAEQYHCEALLRIPRTQWCYEPPLGAPAVAPLPAATRGCVTFGAVADFNKLHPGLLRQWCAILRQTPASHLLVLGIPAAASTDWMFDILEAERIELDCVELRPRTTFDRYLGAYAEIDIALDTHPYNGATTTCEALWMGVPVVSLAGSHGARRSGASLLGSVGLAEMVATSEADYCATAMALASDLPRLLALRAGMRARMLASPLLDAGGVARAVESAYRDAWRRWIAESG